jgi:hypothetical protein
MHSRPPPAAHHQDARLRQSADVLAALAAMPRVIGLAHPLVSHKRPDLFETCEI